MNGKEVYEEQWLEFENSTAYSILDNQIVDIAKTSMQSVFGISNNKENIKINNQLEKLIIANYEDVKDNYSDIKAFRDNYDFESLISKAKLRLQSFLGLDMMDSSAISKPVYFFFLNDAANKKVAIVADLNLIYQMNEEQRINIIAHEFFHIYRTHFENHDFNYANDINFALDMIANEGIANQIDKSDMDYNQYFNTIIKSHELAEEFTELYNKAEKDIEYLQTIIIQYSKGQIDSNACVEKLLEIYKYNGHALGFYMSNQIVEAGFKDEMIKEFHNPYEFYRLYDLALRKNKRASLDEDFLNFLKEATGK